MKKTSLIILTASLVLALLFLLFSFWQALVPDFSAINYLESKGYSSVRILRRPAEGYGCSPDDEYRFVFDAISPQGTQRVEGIVCGGGEVTWYEE